MIYKALQYLLMIIFLFACEGTSQKKMISSFSQLQEKLGKENVELIAHLNVVSIARVIKTKEGFVFDADQKLLSTNEIEHLQKLLFNEEGYIFNKQKKCLFIPEIVFKVSGKKELIIWISPLCKQIKFDDLKHIRILNYDHMAEEFTVFVKSLLEGV
jgi:hypothetical protein